MKLAAPSNSRDDAVLVGLVEREKRFFARQLHEGVLQTLSAASILARVVARHAKVPTAGSSEFAHLQELIDVAIDEARLLIRQIQTPGPDLNSLLAALQELVESTGKKCVCEFRHDLRGGKPLTPPATESLFRIAQEAVHAALQRPKVSRITVILGLSSKLTRLQVRDNGHANKATKAEDYFWSRLLLEAHAGLIDGELTFATTKKGNTISYKCRRTEGGTNC